MEQKILTLIEKLSSDMQAGFQRVDDRLDGIDKRFDAMDERMDGVEGRLTSLENTVLRIEQDHGKKLDVLFDGVVQNSEKLTRIEAQVNKHEEIIFRRVK